MKKIALAVLCSTFTLSQLVGQVTVDSNSIQSPGASLTLLDDTSETMTVGSAGSGQSWNFTTLGQHAQDGVRFLAKSPSIPKSGDFPMSNLVLTFDEDNDSAWSFLQKSDTALWVVGVSSVEIIDAVPDTVSEDFMYKIISFPSSINTTFTTSESDVDITNINVDPDGPGPHTSIDTVKVKFTYSISSLVDADGRADMPHCSWDVIRQRIDETEKDSVYMFHNGSWTTASPELLTYLGRTNAVESETMRSYRWWADDATVGFPLVECSVDENGDVEGEVTYVQIICSGIEEEKGSSVKIYPNPAQGNLNINLDNSGNYQNLQVQMYDLTGKQVKTEKVSFGSNTININNLKSGMYLLRVITDNNNILHEEKINVIGKN